MRHFLLTSLLLILSISAAESTQLKTLRFTIDFAEYDPRFSLIQKTFNEGLKELGYKIELISSLGGREILFAIDRDLDGISGTDPKELLSMNRSQFIQLQNPSATISNIAVSRANISTPATWDELNKSELSIVYVRNHYEAKNSLNKANAISTTTLQQAVKLFLANRVDVLIAFELDGELRALPEFQSKEFQKPVVLSETEIYTFINKRYADQASVFNDNIQRAIKNRSQNTQLIAETLLGNSQIDDKINSNTFR